MVDVLSHAELVQLRQRIVLLDEALGVVRNELAAARQQIAVVGNVAAGSVIKSVQRITVALAMVSVDVGIAPVNPAKTVLILTGASGSFSGLTEAFAHLELINASTVRAVRGNYSYTMTVGVQVVEYY